MTEQEWLQAEVPEPMLEYLRGRASDRRLRLYACACLRQVEGLLIDERSRQALEMAEAFALGLASERQLDAAEWAAREAYEGIDLKTSVIDPTWAACRAAARVADRSAYSAARATTLFVGLAQAPWTLGREGQGLFAERGDPILKAIAREDQCRLLREVFGNPFRAVTLPPGWQS